MYIICCRRIYIYASCLTGPQHICAYDHEHTAVQKRCSLIWMWRMSPCHARAEQAWPGEAKQGGVGSEVRERERLQCFSQPASLITYRRRQRSNMENIKTVQNELENLHMILLCKKGSHGVCVRGKQRSSVIHTWLHIYCFVTCALGQNFMLWKVYFSLPH